MRWFLSLCVLLFSGHLLSAQNNVRDITYDIEPQLTWNIDTALDVVTFHPTINQIATGGRDNAVRLWDSQAGTETAILAGHSDWISSLAYSPDGTMLASGGRDANIWFWNVETGTSLRLIEDHQAEVKAMTFTPDGSYFISGDMNGIVRLEPIGNPSGTQIFENFGGGVWSIAISPDGRTLAIGSDDSAIWLLGLWDSNGTWVTPLVGHRTPVTSLAWSADGAQLLSGEQNGHIYMWDVTDAKQGVDNVSNQLYQGHLAPVTAVDFTADSELFISSALDGAIKIWDTTTESLLTPVYQSVTPLTNLTTDSTNTTSASISPTGGIHIWSLEQAVLNDMVASYRPVIIENTPIPVQQSTVETTAPAQPETVAPTESQPTPATVELPQNSAPTLMIPSVGMQVGIKTFPLDGVSWAIDPNEPLVGHLEGTSWVNGNGNVALAGHSLYPNGRAGVFNRLYNVNLGDEIIVQDGDIIRRYRVSDIRVVDYRDISVVYPTAHSRVTLITCDIPSFVSETGLYGERLVVIADAVN